MISDFEKYHQAGPYHWHQTDPKWKNSQFNPPLLARYVAIKRLLPRKTRKILDIGCGDGFMMHFIGNKYPLKIYGVDISELALRLAKQQLSKHTKGRNWFILVAEAGSLPFSNGCFDVVVLADVIEHLDRPELAFIEAHRVLRKDGVLLLSTPNRQPDCIWDRLHVQEFNTEELKGLAKGFFKHIQVRAYWPMWWFRRWKSGGFWRWLINACTRFGYNPFLHATDQPSESYGQLIVICRK